ncbi:MAG: M48 family metallopeptidase [Lachnospiraceae bacterium]|nr:M48 family metallopeptidase [Lachnospiraceae bacterium]
MSDDLDYTIVRSRRRTLQVEISSDCRITVRAPKYTPLYEIRSFVEERRDWIEKNLAKMQKRLDDVPVKDRFSDREIETLTKNAKETIPPLVKNLAAKMGISYGRVTIRRQKTLWGSCSAKRNLNFNCLIVLLPEPVMEYVIIHELCHLKEMNHSPAFWREVEKYCPDYRYLRDFLKDNGEKLMLRM